MKLIEGRDYLAIIDGEKRKVRLSKLLPNNEAEVTLYNDGNNRKVSGVIIARSRITRSLEIY